MNCFKSILSNWIINEEVWARELMKILAHRGKNCSTSRRFKVELIGFKTSIIECYTRNSNVETKGKFDKKLRVCLVKLQVKHWPLGKGFYRIWKGLLCLFAQIDPFDFPGYIKKTMLWPRRKTDCSRKIKTTNHVKN